jgi:hypothetical protein
VRRGVAWVTADAAHWIADSADVERVIEPSTAGRSALTTDSLVRPNLIDGRVGSMTRTGSAAQQRPALLGPYLGYVGYFVGAGLISGSVVHHPLDPIRYTIIGAAGVLTFLAATVLNEFVLPRQRPAGAQLLRIVGGSLLLSMGIGMLSGGIQHFDEFPARAAILVAAGLVLSFLAYIVRNVPQRWKSVVGPIGLGVLATAVMAFAGLSYLAAHTAAGTHSHGETAADAGHGDEPTNTDRHGAEGQVADHNEEPAARKAPATRTATASRTKATKKADAHAGHPHAGGDHHG